MKTLIIAPFSPYPLIFGGAIRLYNLIKMYATFSDVTLLAYNTWHDKQSSVRHLETICKQAILVDDAPLETKRKWILQAQGLFGPKSFQYHSFYTHHFQREIDAQLQTKQFDFIVVEQSQMGFFNVNQPGALRILDLQNIEYELLARRAAVQSSLPRRIALTVEAIKFKRQEFQIYKQFDLICATSEREREQLRAILPAVRVECIPNSIDPDFFPLRTDERAANEITFIGTTHVDANRDGLIYFMDHIFPLIMRQVPDIHVSIVGGKPPVEIKAYGQKPNVVVTGFVDDVRPYMAQAKVLIVPLRSGGGTRLKILEGLSFGVPTVSTSVGAEGLDLRDGTDILIGDTPQAFADQVIRILKDANLRHHLAHSGRQFVEERYSWRAIGKTLEGFLGEIALQKNHALGNLLPTSN